MREILKKKGVSKQKWDWAVRESICAASRHLRAVPQRDVMRHSRDVSNTAVQQLIRRLTRLERCLAQLSDQFEPRP